MLESISEQLKTLSDAELLDLLDMVSTEVKVRNGLQGSPSDLLNRQDIQHGFKSILEALIKR